MMSKGSDKSSLISRPESGQSLSNRTELSFAFDEAFVIAVALFGAAALLLIQILPPFTVQIWSGLLLVSVTFGFLIEALLVILRRKELDSELLLEATQPPAGQAKGLASSRWIALALFAAFIPAFLSVFLSVRMQLGPHGYFHSAYIYQILVGISPPDNVTLPGYPANFYWIFHALQAAFSDLSHVAPPLVTIVFLLLVFLVTFALAMRILTYLLPTENRPVVRTLLAFFSLFGTTLFGLTHSYYRASQNEPFNELLSRRFLEPTALFGDGRLSLLLKYYISLNGFPVGVLFIFLAILISLRILGKRATALDLVIGIIGAFAAIAFHVVSGIFLVTAVPAALAATLFIAVGLNGHLLSWEWYRHQTKSVWGLIGSDWRWTAVILLLSVVLSLATARFLLESSTTLSARPRIILWQNGSSLFMLRSVFSMVYPLLPFFVLAAMIALQEKDSKLIFLILLSLIGLFQGYVSRIEDNQYKFIYLASFTMCIVCTVPMWRFLFKPSNQVNRLGRLMAILMLGLMFTNILALGMSRLDSPYVEKDNFVFNGTHVDSRTAYRGDPYPEVPLGWTQHTGYLESDLLYADVYQWARQHTSEHAVLIAPLMHKDRSALPLLSERLPYVVDGMGFNNALSEYKKRVIDVDTVFGADSSYTERRTALNLIKDRMNGSDLFLVYPHYLPRSATEELDLLYSGRHADLFSIVSREDVGNSESNAPAEFRFTR